MKNHKTIFLSLIIFSLLSFFVVSCNKDEATHLLPHASITFDAPLSGAVYRANDTVKISGSIVSDSLLHGYAIYLRKKEDKSSIAVFSIHNHATSLTFNQSWVNTFASDTTDVEVEVIATLDHDGNSLGKKVSFKCVP